MKIEFPRKILLHIMLIIFYNFSFTFLASFHILKIFLKEIRKSLSIHLISRFNFTLKFSREDIKKLFVYRKGRIKTRKTV